MVSDWLLALPIANCGLRLDDEAVRVAVGMRLGLSLCVPHNCHCPRSSRNGLQKGTGQNRKTPCFNDVIWRAFGAAGIPAVKEPSGLDRQNGKRPDLLTLIPWHGGRSLVWDVTVVSPLAASRYDTDRTVLSCLVWQRELSRPVRSVPGLCRSESGDAVRPLDALRRRTHLSGGQFTLPHQSRQDCRACLSTAAATQARQAATPSRPTAHAQRRCTPRKCKHAVDCCIRLNPNFFTERHATRVIYRLTVSRFNSHRLTGHRQD